jgi:hypothetical protein
MGYVDTCVTRTICSPERQRNIRTDEVNAKLYEYTVNAVAKPETTMALREERP